MVESKFFFFSNLVLDVDERLLDDVCELVREVIFVHSRLIPVFELLGKNVALFVGTLLPNQSQVCKYGYRYGTIVP